MNVERCHCGKPSITYATYVVDDTFEDPATGHPFEWENPFCAECLASLIEWHNTHKPQSDDGVAWTMTLYPPRGGGNESD